jgi:hypothetical protein
MRSGESKPGGGRPRTELGEAPKRSLRVHDKTWKESLARADELGISPSEYMRRALTYVNADSRWTELTEQIGRRQ